MNNNNSNSNDITMQDIEEAVKDLAQEGLVQYMEKTRTVIIRD
jgi:predicted transcriptional regulator